MTTAILLLIAAILLFGAAKVRSALGSILAIVIFVLAFATLAASCQPDEAYMTESTQ